jgi:enoyl-CoA hydratase
MAEQIAADGTTDGLTCLREGSAGLVTLSRPQKRNALTIAARATLAARLTEYARDPLVYAVVVRSGVEGIFCAGGDVVEMAALADRDMEAAEKALADEIALVWRAECFTKPTVALIDGAVIGGGNGISRFGTHRVAGENYRFAMPETGLGLFPNNGLAHTFARMPKDIGMYLALTGDSVGPADAFHLGLVTHCIAAGEFVAITAALADADPVDPVVDARHVDPGSGPLLALGDVITRCFGAGTVVEIAARLARETGPHAAWAAATRERLLACSRTALVVAHRLIREASAMELRDVLELEHALICRMMELPDLHAGVRARLGKTGEALRWRPGRLEDVSPATIDAIFSAPEEHHLRLPTRRDMQEGMM